jgi:hypothetical protein
MRSEIIKHQVETWLTSFIIKYNICPFAKNEHDRGSIYYAVIESKNTAQCLEAVFLECQWLNHF